MRKIFAYLFVIMLFCTPSLLRAQDTLVAVQPLIERKMVKKKKFSINNNVFFWLNSGPKDNSQYRMDYGKCVGALWGLRFNMDLAPRYTMGIEFDLSGERYVIKQDEEKHFVDDVSYGKEYLKTNTMQLAFTHRFKLNKGIRSTWFLELGVYGVYVYDQSRKLITYGDSPEGYPAGDIKYITVERKLSYKQPFHGGGRVVIGYRYFGAFAQYRFNNLINLGANSQDLPRLSFGIAFFGRPTKF